MSEQTYDNIGRRFYLGVLVPLPPGAAQQGTSRRNFVKAAGALAGGSLLSQTIGHDLAADYTLTIAVKPVELAPKRIVSTATNNYASDDIHPIHLHRHSFELTRVAGQATSGSSRMW